LKLSLVPFSQGLALSTYSVPTPSRPSHARTTAAMNSGPWSERMCSGGPRAMNSSVNVASTSSLDSRRATTIARLSRVNASITVSMRNFLPSWVRSSTKS
jgi:hypothetical protein